MKFGKSLIVASLVSLLSLGVTGCATQKQKHPDARMRSTNFLGIAKSEESAYALPTPTSLDVTTSELADSENISGDRVSLLWGLIKIRDN